MDLNRLTHITGHLKPHCNSQTLSSGVNAQLPDTPCRFVQLHNWTTNSGTVSDDGVEVGNGGQAPPPYSPANGAGTTAPSGSVSGGEVYYGFDGKLVGQIFPGDKTDIMPVTNLREITMRPGGAGAREVFYTYWT